MKITTIELIGAILSVWPRLYWKNLRTSDAYYWTPTRKEVEDFINDTYLKKYKYTSEIMTPKDFVLVLDAFVTQQRYKNMVQSASEQTEEQKLPWAFGYAWLFTRREKIGETAQNICVTSDEGVILMNSKTNEFFIANSGTDFINHIRI